VLDGLMEAAGLAGPEQAGVRLSVLRAIDKLDKFGPEGVRLLLGAGRRDESGDFTKGAGLNADQIAVLEGYITASATADPADLQALRPIFAKAAVGLTGLDELSSLLSQVNAAGYGADRIVVDPSVVRGLEYYTGPVYEAELTFETVNEAGEPARFGSVGGGGRYDGLVGRFRSDDVPATGISIGVSRLAAALRALGRMDGDRRLGPVVVLVLDRDQPSSYQALVGRLRAAGISAEMYLGDAGMKAQMKYADRRGAPCVVIQGSDECARGSVQIKDLIEGAKAAAAIKSNQEWREGRPAQIECSVEDMASHVTEILARHMSPPEPITGSMG
jgi:histidyl-tRNA synthetase